MQKYRKLMKLLTQEFNQVKFTQIPRSQNMGVDELAKQSLSEGGSTSKDLEIEI